MINNLVKGLQCLLAAIAFPHATINDFSIKKLLWRSRMNFRRMTRKDWFMQSPVEIKRK